MKINRLNFVHIRIYCYTVHYVKHYNYSLAFDFSLSLSLSSSLSLSLSLSPSLSLSLSLSLSPSFSDGLSSETVRILSVSKKKGKGKSNELTGGGTAGLTGGEVEASQTSGTIKIYFNFKRYLFDPKKQMIQ